MAKSRLSGLILAVSLVCAIVAAMIVQSQLRDARAAAAATIRTVPVVIVTRSLPAQTVIRTDDVTVADVPAGGRTQGAFTLTGNAVGKVTLEPVFPGEQLLPAMVAGTASSPRLSDHVPFGEVAMSVLYNPVADAGGKIEVGDQVAVLAVLDKQHDGVKADAARVIAQNVLVLSVPQTGFPGASAGSAPSTQALSIILALTPQQADAVGYANNYGQISLLLQSSRGDSDLTQPMVSAANSLGG